MAREEGPYPEHPLFPTEEGVETPDIAFIHIQRRENGALVWGPVFPAHELMSTDQIQERFGGGTYELTARKQNRHHTDQAGSIVKKRLITLPGKPKLLVPDNPTVAEKISAGMAPDPTIPQPSVMQHPTGGMMGDSNLLIAIMQMQMQASQASREQSDKFMMLMMQMMSEGKKEAAASNQQMMQMFTQMTTSQQTSMMQMLPLLMQNRGGGPEEFAKYAELMRSLGFGKSSDKEPDEPENESVGAILENVADIVAGAPQALKAWKDVAGNGVGTPGLAIPQGEPLPGSAASVLAGMQKPGG